MSDCRIYSLCGLSHSFVGGRAEVNACVFLKPLLCKFFKLYCSNNLSHFTFFFKHNALSVKFFLNLTRCHVRFRFPRFRLNNLFTVHIVSAGYFNSITVTALCYCCHWFIPPVINRKPLFSLLSHLFIYIIPSLQAYRQILR